MPISSAIPALQLDQIRFKYAHAEEEALSGVSIQFQQNTFNLIMGATGSGKTSLVRIFNRLIPCFFKGDLQGIVHLLGQNIQSIPVKSMADKIGMVFQDFESQLFSTNSMLDLAFGPENLAIPTEIIRQRMTAVSDTLALKHLLHRDPSTLSGGQKQRLAIASILMLDPPILVLDEPVTDLDPDGQRDVYELITHLSRSGKTIFMIDHNTEYASSCDYLTFLNKGSIIKTGSPSELFIDMNLLHSCHIAPPPVVEILHRLELPLTNTDPDRIYNQMSSSGFTIDTERYQELVFQEQSDLNSNATLIELKNVFFSYDSHVVLDNVSCRISRQDFCAIVGQNGSGKTTLAKQLNGLLSPSSGEVLFNGTHVSEMPVRLRAKSIGYVFQNPDHQIFCPTVYEELEFGLRNIGLTEKDIPDRIQESLRTVGLADKQEADPFILPKGDRQRVAVASILAMQPEVLILDEPTTGLDHWDQIAMMELLKKLNQRGHTIIIITHSMPIVVKYARRALVLSSGRFIYDGDVRRLFLEDQLLDTASLTAPPIARFSRHFGIVSRDAVEFTELLLRNNPHYR